jgi:hypothetical protein
MSMATIKGKDSAHTIWITRPTSFRHIVQFERSAFAEFMVFAALIVLGTYATQDRREIRSGYRPNVHCSHLTAPPLGSPPVPRAEPTVRRFGSVIRPFEVTREQQGTGRSLYASISSAGLVV